MLVDQRSMVNQQSGLESVLKLSGRWAYCLLKGVRPGVDDDFCDAIFLLLPLGIHLRHLLDSDDVRDEKAWIDVTLLHMFQERLEVAVHMGLTHVHMNALSEGRSEIDLVEHSSIHPRDRERSAFSDRLNGLA